MDQLKDLLRSAREEIISLRRVNERQGIRITAIDDMLSLLHGKPGQAVQQGQGIDVVFEIDRALAELKK